MTKTFFYVWIIVKKIRCQLDITTTKYNVLPVTQLILNQIEPIITQKYSVPIKITKANPDYKLYAHSSVGCP